MTRDASKALGTQTQSSIPHPMANSGRPFKVDVKIANLRQNIAYDEFALVKTTLQEFGIDATDSDKRTALMHCIIENKYEFAKWLISNGANVNSEDRGGYTALHFCAEDNCCDFAELLLENKANPNTVDQHGNSPLWTAVFNSKNDNKLVQLLLQFNANPDLVNKHGKTPGIMYRTFYGRDIKELL